jgi:hypothetical protein
MATQLDSLQIQGRPIKAIINSILHGGVAMVAGAIIDSFFPHNASVPLSTKVLELALQNAAGGLVLSALIEIGFSPEDPMQGAYIVVPFILSQPGYIQRMHDVVGDIKTYVEGIVGPKGGNTTPSQLQK